MEENILGEIISQVGRDLEVQERLKYWIGIIEKEEVTVSTRSDIPASSYENKTIKISTHREASRNECVLWDLIHEYGHYLDDDLVGKGTCFRELRAWEKAKLLLQKDPLYIKRKSSFASHKNNCLTRYREDDLMRFQKRICRVTFMDETAIEGILIAVNVVQRTFRFQELEKKDYPTDNVKRVEPL